MSYKSKTKSTLMQLGFTKKAKTKTTQLPKTKGDSKLDEATIAGTVVGGGMSGFNEIKKRQALKKAPKNWEEAQKVIRGVVGKARPGDILFVTNPTLMPDAGKLHPTMVVSPGISMDIHPGKKSDVQNVSEKVKDIRDKASKPFHGEPISGKLKYYARGQKKDEYSAKAFAEIKGLYRPKDPEHVKSGPKNLLRMSREPAGTYGYGMSSLQSSLCNQRTLLVIMA